MTITAAHTTTDFVRDTVADEFHAAAALFVLQAACIGQIAHQALPVVPQHGDTPATTLLDLCEALSGADLLAAIAITDLRAFFASTSLRQRRIVLNDGGIERCITALHLAAERGNRGAFETLLRRGLNFLVEPLLAV